MRKELKTACLSLAMASFVLVATSVTAQAATKCMSNSQMGAERVRALQSGLMVAALKCVHRPELFLQENYNAVVIRFQKELVAQSYVLQDYFRTTYGGSHRHHLNKYITSLANQFSVITFEHPLFCETMAKLGKSLLLDRDGIILEARFDTEMLPDPIALNCRQLENPDFVYINRKIPDMVSIHMPEIDARARQQLSLN